VIYVLIRKDTFLFLDIDAEYSQKYDIWYFNKNNILLNIDWQLENNKKLDNKFIDCVYQAEEYDANSYPVIECIKGFGINNLEEMKKEVIKYILYE